MEKFVPFEKMSKKQQKEINKKRRGAIIAKPPETFSDKKNDYNRQSSKQKARKEIDDFDER
jgi:hypothetical protein